MLTTVSPTPFSIVYSIRYYASAYNVAVFAYHTPHAYTLGYSGSGYHTPHAQYPQSSVPSQFWYSRNVRHGVRSKQTWRYWEYFEYPDDVVCPLWDIHGRICVFCVFFLAYGEREETGILYIDFMAVFLERW